MVIRKSNQITGTRLGTQTRERGETKCNAPSIQVSLGTPYIIHVNITEQQSLPEVCECK